MVGCEEGEDETEKKGIVPRKAVRKANPIVPQPIVHAVWTSLKRLRASSKRPAVLARAASMTPAGGADEDGARAPVSRPSGRGGEVSVLTHG